MLGYKCATASSLRDEGMAPRSRLAGGGCKPPYAALVKSYGRKRYGKGNLICQVWIMEMNASEPLHKCRKGIDGIKTGKFMLFQDKSGGYLLYWPGDTRHRGGMNMIWAFKLNCGNLSW